VARETAEANLEAALQQLFAAQPPAEEAKNLRIVLEGGSAGFPGIQGDSKQSLQLLGAILSALRSRLRRRCIHPCHPQAP
jgi:hypothetical protein